MWGAGRLIRFQFNVCPRPTDDTNAAWEHSVYRSVCHLKKRYHMEWICKWKASEKWGSTLSARKRTSSFLWSPFLASFVSQEYMRRFAIWISYMSFKYFQRSTEFCPLRCFCHSVNCILSTGRALISWGVDGTLMTLHWLLVLYPMHPMLWSLCNKWPSSSSANGEKTLTWSACLWWFLWLFLMVFTICFASSKLWVSLAYL